MADRQKCRTCGHEMLTDSEKEILVNDAAASMGILIRDMLHNNVDKEAAEMFALRAILDGIDHVETSIRAASDINSILAANEFRKRKKT